MEVRVMKWFSVRISADYLGIGQEELHNLVEACEIDGVWDHGELLLEKASLMDYKQRRNAPAPAKRPRRPPPIGGKKRQQRVRRA